MPSEIPVIASMWSLVETSDTKYSTQYMYLMAEYDGSCSKVINCVEHFKILYNQIDDAYNRSWL